MRILIVTLLAALSAATANADALVLKRGKKIVGMKSKIGGVTIDFTNYKAYLDQSNGVITRDGYDAIWFKKSDKKSSKEVRYDRKDVIAVEYSSEPDSLLDGYDHQATGQWSRAIRAFRECTDDTGCRPVYRIEASYMVGICYIRAGSRTNASKHFARWKFGNSIYTPQVYRIMAELLTGAKKYKAARKWYARIGELENITRGLKFASRLGGVKVDIEERKFDQAESSATALVREIGGARDLADARALARALQASAILKSDKTSRFGEAQKILEGAVSELKRVSDGTQALVYSSLGDAIYKQGKPEEARYSYMRVVCLYPGETGFVAKALLNAGQCFLDMSGREKDDQKASDELLVQGMKLLFECAGRHKGTSSAKPARSAYRKYKQDLEAARKRLG